VFQQILDDALSAVRGGRAAIFLDGDGEAIAQAGDHSADMQFLAAWKEIHLDHIRQIAGSIGMGTVHAVLFSLDEGNELIIPVDGEYCLVVFLSSYAQIQDALAEMKKAAELLQKEMG